MSSHLGQALFAVVASVCLSSTARAEQRFGDSIVVERGEVIRGNLYITGGEIAVHGTVEGDLIALGRSVLVDGVVNGDLLLAGGVLRTAGETRGDVRAMGGQITMQTPISGDATIFGGDVAMNAAVGGDALVGGSAVSVDGPVSGDLLIAGNTMRVDAPVRGSVTARGRNLAFGSHTRVDGDVDAITATSVLLPPQATIAGALRERRLDNRPPALVAGIAWLHLTVGLFLLGFLWVTFFPGFVQRAVTELRGRPGLSLGIGTLVFVLVPVVLVVTATLGAVVGGWWLSVFGLASYAMAMALTAPLVALTGAQSLSRRLRLKERSAWLQLLVGIAVWCGLACLPVVGSAVSVLSLLFGLGALTRSLSSTLRRTRRQEEMHTIGVAPASGPLPVGT